MSKKPPLPPELGGSLSKEEWVDATKREDSAKFYRDVKDAAAATPAADQVRILRHMADEIERHSAGDPVKRSQDRVREREAWPNRAFFAPSGPAKPSEEMRRRWIDEHRARHGKQPIEWGPLTTRTKPEPRPLPPTSAEQAAQLKARADEVQPMKAFSPSRAAIPETPRMHTFDSDCGKFRANIRTSDKPPEFHWSALVPYNGMPGHYFVESRREHMPVDLTDKVDKFLKEHQLRRDPVAAWEAMAREQHQHEHVAAEPMETPHGNAYPSQPMKPYAERFKQKAAEQTAVERSRDRDRDFDRDR